MKPEKFESVRVQAQRDTQPEPIKHQLLKQSSSRPTDTVYAGKLEIELVGDCKIFLISFIRRRERKIN